MPSSQEHGKSQSHLHMLIHGSMFCKIAVACGPLQDQGEPPAEGLQYLANATDDSHNASNNGAPMMPPPPFGVSPVPAAPPVVDPSGSDSPGAHPLAGSPSPDAAEQPV
jgi:hypothetical protein